MTDPLPETRVLALLPNVADAGRTVGFLAEVGVACTACAEMTELTEALGQGAGAVLVAEESLCATPPAPSGRRWPPSRPGRRCR